VGHEGTPIDENRGAEGDKKGDSMQQKHVKMLTRYWITEAKRYEANVINVENEPAL
jgi:hypothetical protein